MKATIKDVAKLSGVSISTVSRYLNGNKRVNPISVTKIEKAIKELDYLPNQVARSLKNNETHTVGIIVSDIANPFFMNVSKYIEDVISQYDYNLIVCSSNEDREKELKYLRMLTEKRVDGLIISPTGKNNDYLIDISKSDTPVLIIDRESDIPGADMVIEDNYSGGFLLAEDLIENGHKRIAVFKGSVNSITSEQRFKGITDCFEKYGIRLDKDLIAMNCVNEQSTYDAAESILSMKDKPTAVIAINPRIVNGFIMYANKNKVSIPEDISLVGIVLKQNNIIYPNAITCVEQSPDVFGYKVGELIIKRLKSKGKNSQVPTKFVFDQRLTSGETVKYIK